jgi:Domain of unknown function (DUF6458)
MGIGTAIFLFAVGAILRFAVTVQATGVNLQTVGDILMIVGALGIVFSVIFWSSWGGFGNFGSRRQATIVDRSTVIERQPPLY